MLVKANSFGSLVRYDMHTISLAVSDWWFWPEMNFFSHTHSVSIKFLTSTDFDRPDSRDGVMTKDICRLGAAVLHRARALLRVYVTDVRETTVLLLVVVDATAALSHVFRGQHRQFRAQGRTSRGSGRPSTPETA